jgi:hypothetical protein
MDNADTVLKNLLSGFMQENSQFLRPFPSSFFKGQGHETEFNCFDKQLALLPAPNLFVHGMTSCFLLAHCFRKPY